MRVMTVFGTRPEMVKLSSTIKKLDALDFEHVMVHTGQNFTAELRDFFFRDLDLREPDYQLHIDTSSYAREVADIIVKTDELLEKVRPDALLVLGDTFSGLSVMPAAQRGIKIFHMEAGMRAWDVRMPEQRNRVLIDHMSTYNLPYTQYHRENLLREGLHPSKIFVTGNPTFEVMRRHMPQVLESVILENLGLSPKSYFVVSFHRSENVDNPEVLSSLLETMKKLTSIYDKKVVWTVHPRTRSKLGTISLPGDILAIDPLGFLDFNKLLADCACVLSDSGTAPEEAYVYKIPCISLRGTTERVETVEGGAHIIAGVEPENIVAAVETALRQDWSGRYQLEEDFSPSTVVVNLIRSRLVNYF
jgi:UDP-N-acetylglucosamine 2-epimerase (non-hydrolysing)